MTEEMFLKAETMGCTLLHSKPTKFIDEGFYIVLAITPRNEFVTWKWANGGFHHGHYFGDITWANRREAFEDYKARH